MEPKSFASPVAWRAWLGKNHTRENEILLKTRPPGDVRTHAFWVMSPVKEETRLRRLDTLIGCWERGESAPPLARMKKGASR